MKFRILCCVAMLLCVGCNKAVDNFLEKAILPSTISNTPVSDFIQYIIPQNQHSSDKSKLKLLDINELHFVVKFDSSAIYYTKDRVNQYDINKLYGFSDNNTEHHQYSARFGWRWSDGALRLFAYVYNEGKVTSKELGVAAIGAEIACNIKVEGSQYIFTVNDKSETMSRLSKTTSAKGYLLYPYFGGDETAPHEVRIWIKND